MNVNTDALRKTAPWLIAAAVPVAGYFIYRGLTPHQKKKFKRSLSEGSLAFASALISKAVREYKKHSAVASMTGENRFAAMAVIPNRDESETTIGNEKW